MYGIFILIIALLIKGNYLLKRSKGLKYSQCLKISLVSSLQSALISLVLSLFGISFTTVFGLLLAVRVIYIYIRYTGSKKNVEWLEDLYTKDERFKV
jgi:hypothetical protein